MKVETPSLPHLPERIARLGELAYNLWWSWHNDARFLFRRVDRTVWRQTGHNPVILLKEVRAETLDALTEDPDFLKLYDEVLERFDRYLLGKDTPFQRDFPEGGSTQIAYLCAEFALHSSLPIYSGGLGLLAGDTCMEASDLGLPFVGIGSLYPEGYFHQRIAADGTQEAHYQRLKTEDTPLLPVLNDDGSRLLVEVPVGHREVKVAIWKVQVGRVPIYLMDTDIPENDPWDRDLSARLYGGDQHVRLRQEIILGIGGVRVLRALGYAPSVVHLNEGHAAFASLERIREFMNLGDDFHTAVSKVREETVFTTHTPVKAGHDEFPFHLMEEFFQPYWENLSLSREEFLGLGMGPAGNNFSMTVLALKTASRANGVSQKHGRVSREMWNFLWPSRTLDDVPIFSITNGVHVPTWVAPELASLWEAYLGRDWLAHHEDPALWNKVLEIPDEEIWRIHETLKQRLLGFVRERARLRWIQDGVSPGQMAALGGLLCPNTLTIGFARRFATYKRAGLIFRDFERLKRLVHNPWQPVQVIFAGKAHPADEPGKYLLNQVFQVAASHEMGGRISFIEDYDKHVAHHLVQGVDLWLNNPQPPKEASGTSGQKTSLNGVPNFSVLDGWWAEGYNGKNGWAIEGDNDEETAQSLYDVLENQIVPTYYDRGNDGIPRKWVALMKEAIRSTTAPFSTRRMLLDYTRKMYSISPALAERAASEIS